MPAPTFDQDLADRILDAVSEGASLSRACNSVGVARTTVRSWMERQPDFARASAAAFRMRLQTLADEVIDIVDDVAGSDSAPAVQAARVRAENRRWLLAKLLPATYGDKLALTGNDGKALIPATRESRLPQLVSVLALLAPEKTNSELFEIAGKALDRAASPGLRVIPGGAGGTSEPTLLGSLGTARPSPEHG